MLRPKASRGGGARRLGHRISRVVLVLCSVAVVLTQSAAAASIGRQADPRKASPWPPEPGVRFEHLSLAEGLSQSVVNAITQDPAGFIWLATQDGLNRFDGSEIRVFKRNPEDPASLSANNITALLVDSKGQLWLGTNGGGLDLYDPATETFTHFRHVAGDESSLNSNLIYSLVEAADGSLWVGTDQGLGHFNPATGRTRRYVYDPSDPASLGGMAVFYLYLSPQGTLWVGTYGSGLSRLDPGADRFVRYANNPPDPGSLADNSVQCVLGDSKGRIWVGLDGSGLDRLDPETGSIKHFRPDEKRPGALASGDVTELLLDQSGDLWVGTAGGGLHRYDESADSFTRFQAAPGDAQSLASNVIQSVFEDRAGVLWFGTFGAGVDRYDPLGQKFGLLRGDPEGGSGLSNAQIWAILEDRDGALWFGTNGSGVDRFDRERGTWSNFPANPEDPAALQASWVLALYEDSRGDVWAGTFGGGASRYDRTTRTFSTLADAGFVFDILEDREGVLWLATGGGLAKLNASRDSFRLYSGTPDDPQSFADNALMTLLEDTQGRFWVGSGSGGLALFDRQTGLVRRYQNDPQNPSSLSDNTVMSLLEDGHGRIWIGTTLGLNRFDPEAGTFVHYLEKDGLANDTVYGIVEDGTGRLWLSTNKGLSRFDPETESFRNYGARDGLQGDEFNQGASFKDRAGFLYFGGIEGITVFDPQAVRDNPYVMPIVLTGFDLFNQRVRPGPDTVLPAPIDQLGSLRLTYREGFFALHFAGLHYSAPEMHRYAYRMEGLDRDWVDVGAQRTATYTNVPPGDYTFRVRGANRDGTWNEGGASLRVVVTPPFWETWWFRLLVAAAVIGGIVGGVTLRLRSIRAQNRRLEDQVAQRTGELREALEEVRASKDAAEAANRAKSAFLANMSHEFRTPLNAILGFSQLMLRPGSRPASAGHELTPEQRENLQVIVHSGEHLLGLINDVLEMSKIEAGRTTLNEQGFDLQRMLDGLEEMFGLRARQKGLGLSCELAADVPRYVQADEGKLRQVLMNLLGNAVKFTSQGGVVLRIRRVNDAAAQAACLLSFEVEDSGPGITPEEQQALFRPFAQAASGQRAQEGTGLGLAISRQFAQLMGGTLDLSSEPGRGSIFTLVVPVQPLDAGDLRTALPTRRVVALEPGQSEFRVLVVDDKEVNRQLLVRSLSPLGFQVREAENGQQAIEAWEAWSPQVILMDMRMPVMDGYEATRRIKATTRGQATVIVAVTASALEEERAVILSEGCDAYIRKPFREDELLDTLADHLGIRYTYAQVEGASVATAEAGTERAQVIERLAAMPAVLLTQLERAAVVGDLQRINLLLADIRAADTGLGDHLIRLSSQFRHDDILALVREAAGSHAG